MTRTWPFGSCSSSLQPPTAEAYRHRVRHLHQFQADRGQLEHHMVDKWIFGPAQYPS
uniref:Uncharacterized protein n=1 Tax=Zea mays TaxID=4577 RepID=C0PCR4_MAIZE|nr:unknown [Zea mays]